MNGKPWTEQQLTILKEKYANSLTADLAVEIDRGVKSLYSMAKILGLAKSEGFYNSEDYRKSCIRRDLKDKSGQFQKGHKSWNSGMKGLKIPGSEKTWFAKGRKPANTKFDGAITLRNDKSGHSYFWIRLDNAKWRMLHVWMWEKYIGPIDKGFVIVFADKKSTNCKLENLIKISRVEHLARNRNRKKMGQSLSAYHKKGASDKHIATYLTYKNPELREEILKNPELLQIKRAQLKLKRLIKNATEAKTQSHDR